MQPFKVMEHESRAESDRIPLFQVMIDPFSASLEDFPGAVKFAIVLQIMHANLESVRVQMIAQFLRCGVIAFGNEIEGGAKAQARIKFHELPAAVESPFAFHIMRENEREALPFG